ncbi:hypothetical protein [Pedobacter steynii]
MQDLFMKNIHFLLLFTFAFATSYAQNSPSQVYPKIAGYVGILHPIVTFSNAGTDHNFGKHYVVGMPVGINIWKSKSIGFSAEFVPSIRAENGSSKMANFTFHPGVLVALSSGFTFAGRVAFETSGRYGITPVLNKTVAKGKGSSLFVAVPLPLRFGNDKPASFALGFQFGIAF